MTTVEMRRAKGADCEPMARSERSYCHGGATIARRASAAIACLAIHLAGCTAESTRFAIQTQRRADAVQQTVFERQHEGLVLLLFRDVAARLERCKTAEERLAALNAAWNERDLIEFWAVQHERSRGLRLIGVDAKLSSEQSIVDLLIRSIEAKADRAAQSLAGAAGEQAGRSVVERSRAQN